MLSICRIYLRGFGRCSLWITSDSDSYNVFFFVFIFLLAIVHLSTKFLMKNIFFIMRFSKVQLILINKFKTKLVY